MSRLRFWITTVFLVALLTSCNPQYPETCPSSTPVGLANASQIANDHSLPFRFPLDESPIDETLYFGWFGVSNECPPEMLDCYEFPEVKFHAAEDYKRLPGTPVYAMADGKISFSGPAGGYGWLILIDHPQANLYSLYGHLSPSRWKLEKGTNVERGEMIAYLGDPDENGGSKETPLDPHLHFGVRAGQIMDYPAKGEWRYNGGWIRLCPQDIGWLQPSLVITNQAIPAGGFPLPDIGFITRYGFELIFASSFTLFGIFMSHSLYKQKKRFLLFLPGAIILVAGIFLNINGLVRGYLVPVIGILIIALAAFYFIRQPPPNKET
jgi:hypothetical protein